MTSFLRTRTLDLLTWKDSERIGSRDQVRLPPFGPEEEGSSLNHRPSSDLHHLRKKNLICPGLSMSSIKPDVVYTPFLLGGVMKAADNKSPVYNRAKALHMTKYGLI